MRITSLRALESIFLDGCFSTSSDSPRAGEITAWLGSFANLKRIEVSQFIFDSFSQLRDMVCACPGLKLLRICRCRSRARGPLLEHHSLPEPQIPPCPPLRALRTVNCEFDDELFKWVAMGASSSPLKSICIGFDTVVRHQASLGRLLRALGPTLEQLSIKYDSFNFSHDASISYEQIDLIHNTRLEVLSFWEVPLPIIRHNGLSIIKQVSSSNFRELNVSLHHHLWGPGPLLVGGAKSLPELAAIDTLLQHPGFANLEGFNIGLPRTMDSIRGFFPLTAARNRLRIMSARDVQRSHALRNGEGSVWTWP
ncbi:hypothetical protein FIBSPDRAFT_904556 [Athelia psychrophila]|uniref:F-box domain-containing protein n=1 Tax=Athelia psychrophila TaxID=1759441 RepID=A0A167UKT1_9AGAM|nr:hypothetical protein FIBSPDRAFT_904556 [Fibularhizoctonia sp. CBS 109695]